MPTTKKKTTNAKEKSKSQLQKSGEEIYKELHKMGDEVVSMIKEAKGKYDNADEDTKKKIVAGIAGAGALIAGAIGLSRIKKKK